MDIFCTVHYFLINGPFLIHGSFAAHSSFLENGSFFGSPMNSGSVDFLTPSIIFEHWIILWFIEHSWSVDLWSIDYLWPIVLFLSVDHFLSMNNFSRWSIDDGSFLVRGLYDNLWTMDQRTVDGTLNRNWSNNRGFWHGSKISNRVVRKFVMKVDFWD